MPQNFDTDSICIHELFSLRAEIDSFIDAYCLTEECYSEGSSEYSELKQLTEAKSHKLRGRVRGLAIDWGIHAEFLEQYSRTKQSLQSAA